MRKRWRSRGFTLVEVIVVIVLIGIVASVAATLMLEGVTSSKVSQGRTSIVEQGNLALERMSRDMRAIRSNSSSDLDISSSTAITFIMVGGTSVTYSINGSNQLLRNSQVVAQDVTSLIFSYLTSSGAVAGSSSEVYYIKINFQITKGNLTDDFVTAVNLHNV